MKTANDIKAAFMRHYNHPNGLQDYNPALNGVVIGLLNDACGGKYNRYTVSEFLTGSKSSRLWSRSHWYAMHLFTDPVKPSDDAKWVCGHGKLQAMVNCILQEVGKGWAEQLELIPLEMYTDKDKEL